ncbi:MAG: hypothetical protein AW10_01378 [Candidatus Accumulibacter appositus]|uniref:Uncharacterized protein n=1 Tax=Candidatus Accumulibacter appositus TaxID=1454003 RepID=A0A011NES5_9PROT|nr:MAG: hypothetical protein AW10_01378 [Candidatus Accumulibacter appositus]
MPALVCSRASCASARGPLVSFARSASFDASRRASAFSKTACMATCCGSGWDMSTSCVPMAATTQASAARRRSNQRKPRKARFRAGGDDGAGGAAGAWARSHSSLLGAIAAPSMACALSPLAMPRRTASRRGAWADSMLAAIFRKEACRLAGGSKADGMASRRVLSSLAVPDAAACPAAVSVRMASCWACAARAARAKAASNSAAADGT